MLIYFALKIRNGSVPKVNIQCSKIPSQALVSAALMTENLQLI